MTPAMMRARAESPGAVRVDYYRLRAIRPARVHFDIHAGGKFAIWIRARMATLGTLITLFLLYPMSYVLM